MTTDYLCRPCIASAEWLVAKLPGKIRDLRTTAARMDRLEGLGAPLAAGRTFDPEPAPSDLPAALRSSMSTIALVGTPWPYAPDAAQLVRQAAAGLQSWAEHLAGLKGGQRAAQHEPGPVGDKWGVRIEGPTCPDRYCAHRTCQRIMRQEPLDPDIEATITIVRNLHLAGGDPRAAEMIRSLEQLDQALDYARDRREPDMFVGRCDAVNVRSDVDGDGVIRVATGPCRAELYARLEDTAVKCRACDTNHDIATIRKKLLAELDDAWARPAVIATALSNLGAPIPVDTIYKWIERAKIRRDGVPWPEGTDLTKVKDKEWKIRPRPPAPGDFFQGDLQSAELGYPVYRVGDVRARLKTKTDDADG